MTKRKRPSSVRRIFNSVLVALPLVAAVAFALVSATREPQPSSLAIREADRLPDVALEDETGATRSLRELMDGASGAVLVMHPNCPHCHREIADLIEVISGLEERDRPRVVVVSLGDPAETARVRRQYPTLAVVRDAAETFVGTYRLDAVPVLLRVDDTGTVRSVRVGAQDAAALRALLAGQAPDHS